MNTLKIVAVRRACILMSLVVKEVSNAKLRYNIKIDNNKQMPIDKMDNNSLFIVRARIKDIKERAMIILLFL